MYFADLMLGTIALGTVVAPTGALGTVTAADDADDLPDTPDADAVGDTAFVRFPCDLNLL